MFQDKSSNIVWHQTEVNSQMRQELFRQKGAVLWFTGLSGSGKSTVAHRVEKMLVEKGHFSYVLDGDNIRHGLNKDLSFSVEDRQENIRRISEVAKLFVHAGAVVISAFISPFQRDRKMVRELLGAGEMVEVHVATPIEVCEKRDPKGLYAKARSGEIPDFTGISSPYEPPENPEIVIDTTYDSVDVCAVKVVDWLKASGYLF